MKRKIINSILGPVLVFLMVGTASGSAVLAAYSPHQSMVRFQGEQPYSDGSRVTPKEGPADARSTTGPEPSPVHIKGKASPELDYQVVIPDVPAYLWYRVCGPTAAGMNTLSLQDNNNRCNWL